MIDSVIGSVSLLETLCFIPNVIWLLPTCLYNPILHLFRRNFIFLDFF